MYSECQNILSMKSVSKVQFECDSEKVFLFALFVILKTIKQGILPCLVPVINSVLMPLRSQSSLCITRSQKCWHVARALPLCHAHHLSLRLHSEPVSCWSGPSARIWAIRRGTLLASAFSWQYFLWEREITHRIIYEGPQFLEYFRLSFPKVQGQGINPHRRMSRRTSAGAFVKKNLASRRYTKTDIKPRHSCI